MMPRRKIIIASPQEPSGATWLINCFLELGVLIYRGPQWQNMWVKNNDQYTLSPKEDILKKWLPSLSTKKNFYFDQDVEVEWVHEWPTERFSDKQIIFFLRDPRDALYSRYKRESPYANFSDYVHFLDPALLLNKMEINLIFTKMWRLHPQCCVFNFEDYKTNSEITLRKILDYVRLDFSDEAIHRALAASDSEQAAEMEKKWNEKFKMNHDGVWLQIINQGGIVGRWQQLEEQDLILTEKILALRERIDSSNTQEFASYLFFLKKNRLLKGVNYPSNLSFDFLKVQALEECALSFATELSHQQGIDAGLTLDQMTHLFKTAATMAYKRHSPTFRKIKLQYKKNIGTTSQLYLAIFRRTGRILALFRCNPFYILKLIVKKCAYIIQKKIVTIY